METKGSRRISKALITFMVIAKVSYVYMVVTFFRMDWVEYDTVERSWSVEAMECVSEPARAVIVFYEDTSSDPDFPLRFTRALYNHLSSQPQRAVSINRKVIGYLPEWNYGIFIPRSVAGRSVNDGWIIPKDAYDGCSFLADANVTKQALSTKVRMR